MKVNLKFLLNAIGGILALFGVLFVAIKFNDYASEIDSSIFEYKIWVIVLLLSFLYATISILLAVAWHKILIYFDVYTDKIVFIRIYGISQLAKYIPGNIFHLVGRQALGMAEGLPGKALAKSALWEISLISISGATFVILIVSLFIDAHIFSFTFILYFLLVFLLAKIIKQHLSSDIASAFILQTLFLFFSGMIFVVILAYITNDPIASHLVFTICGAYVFAWLLGLITPGAPAGLGIREMVLIFLLGNIIEPADLLVAILFSRVVTVIGDMLFFSASSMLSQKNADPPPCE